MTPLRQRMLEDLQIRHYSPTTIRIYLRVIAEFARHFSKPPDQLDAEHIRCYQLFLIKQKRVSQSTYIQIVCALRFFYTHTLGRKIGIERIPFPRRERKLPLILSREEVKALLEAPRNLRQRTMLAVLYGSGLRVSEVTQLKAGDIDSARNVLWVRSGKGRKDRQTLLPTKLLELLRCYWRIRRPTVWLFPGTDPTRPISPKAVFLACRKAGRKAAFLNRCIRTCCGMPSLHIFLKPALISAPSRSYSVTPTWRPRRAIYRSLMYRSALHSVLWIRWTSILFPASNETTSAGTGRCLPHP